LVVADYCIAEKLLTWGDTWGAKLGKAHPQNTSYAFRYSITEGNLTYVTPCLLTSRAVKQDANESDSQHFWKFTHFAG